MGTDDLGRDVCSRMVHGAAVSLKVGFVAVGIAVVIGLFFGALAGYYGGVADILVSRLIEIVMCFPVLLSHPRRDRVPAAEHLQHHDRDRDHPLDGDRPLRPR